MGELSELFERMVAAVNYHYDSSGFHRNADTGKQLKKNSEISDWLDGNGSFAAAFDPFL